MRGVRPSLLVLILAVSPGAVEAQTGAAADAEFSEIYRELIEINATDSVGDTTRAADAMAARLRAAGFPAADVQVLAPHQKKGNLVARLRGSGAGKPLLLLAHLDMVEARREDWSSDPFELLEQDGYFYARGRIDDKAMAAIFVDTLIRLKRDGFVPRSPRTSDASGPWRTERGCARRCRRRWTMPTSTRSSIRRGPSRRA